MRGLLNTSVVLLGSILLSGAAHSQPTTIPTRLDCGEFSGGNKSAAFTSPLEITIQNHQLKAERDLMSNPGSEVYSGTIDALGRIKLVGAHFGTNAWELHFAGQLSEKAPTILTGDLKVTAGTAGQRKCTITFLQKPADLMEILSR